MKAETQEETRVPHTRGLCIDQYEAAWRGTGHRELQNQ